MLAVENLTKTYRIFGHPGARIKSVDQEAKMLHFEDGSEAPFDLLIATPIHQAPSVVRAAGLGYAMPGTVLALGLLIPLAALDNRIDAGLRSLLGISSGLRRGDRERQSSRIQPIPDQLVQPRLE